MMNNKLYFKSFMLRNRENLRNHLEAGYVEYSKEGYLTLIKIIENEINNPEQDIGELKEIVIDFRVEVEKHKNAFQDEVYQAFFKNEKITNFIKK